jgi:hypothetical protein
MSLHDLQLALDTLKRSSAAFKIMREFLPAGDPFCEAQADKLELAAIDLLQRIRKAEDDLQR